MLTFLYRLPSTARLMWIMPADTLAQYKLRYNFFSAMSSHNAKVQNTCGNSAYEYSGTDCTCPIFFLRLLFCVIKFLNNHK